MAPSWIAAVVGRYGGVLCRGDLLASVSADCLDRAIAAGHLVRVLPRVYVVPEIEHDVAARERAALLWAGNGTGLSHLSALRRYKLPVPADHAVHVTAPGSRQRRAQPDFRLHRLTGFRVGAPTTIRRGGLDVVRLEQAVVTSWPLLAADEQRAPAIAAVRERKTTPAKLMEVARAWPRLEGAADLLSLIGMLAAGCHSELELWGYRHVFDVDALAGGEWQLPLTIGRRRNYLDRGYREERLAFELDGRKYHSTPAQREADMRRDAEAAMVGWQTVRFSHQRLTLYPVETQREAVAIRTVRRQQLGLPAVA